MAIEMSRDYPLRTRDFDRNRRIKPSSILDLFQEIAQVQADSMDIGSDDMAAQGVFWAVVRQKFEVLGQPHMGEAVTARTWPYTSSRFAFQRDYQLRDAAGGLLVKATSEWVLMNREKRAFEPLAGHFDESITFSEERNFPKKARKIRDFDAEGLTAFRTTPGESTVDLNGHVNNACYADFVTDALAVLMPKKLDAVVKTYQVDYRHEVLAGEPLSLYAIEPEPGIVRVKGENEAGEVAFAAEIGLA